MTSQEQELLTRVARAIYEGRNGKGAVPWSRREGVHREPYLKDARAAIEAMMDQYPEAWLIPHACAVLGDGDRAAAFAADGHEVVPLYRLLGAPVSKGEE